jgi:hypothetical protein
MAEHEIDPETNLPIGVPVDDTPADAPVAESIAGRECGMASSAGSTLRISTKRVARSYRSRLCAAIRSGLHYFVRFTRSDRSVGRSNGGFSAATRGSVSAFFRNSTIVP